MRFSVLPFPDVLPWNLCDKYRKISFLSVMVRPESSSYFSCTFGWYPSSVSGSRRRSSRRSRSDLRFSTEMGALFTSRSGWWYMPATRSIRLLSSRKPRSFETCSVAMIPFPTVSSVATPSSSLPSSWAAAAPPCADQPASAVLASPDNSIASPSASPDSAAAAAVVGGTAASPKSFPTVRTNSAMDVSTIGPPASSAPPPPASLSSVTLVVPVLCTACATRSAPDVLLLFFFSLRALASASAISSSAATSASSSGSPARSSSISPSSSVSPSFKASRLTTVRCRGLPSAAAAPGSSAAPAPLVMSSTDCPVMAATAATAPPVATVPSSLRALLALREPWSLEAPDAGMASRSSAVSALDFFGFFTFFFRFFLKVAISSVV
mmetsp:Transcript_29448/g.77172  ORF Transcript_29448/g.77172 Transcript_29448/m.77172 type:complete len:381 (-) Transcript_29448:904-2046(-)